MREKLITLLDQVNNDRDTLGIYGIKQAVDKIREYVPQGISILEVCQIYDVEGNPILSEDTVYIL